MKKIRFFSYLIVLFYFSYVNTFAQIPVTDIAANAQLTAVNSNLGILNNLLVQQNATASQNKLENYKQLLLGKDNFNFVKQVESYMWKADEYLKRGNEIQMIYNKEEDILKKLQIIKRNASKYRKFENAQGLIGQINKNISSTLYQIGSLVDNAHGVLSDNNVRMSTEGRREILKETLSKLFIIEWNLDNVILEGEISTIKEEQAVREAQYDQDVRNSMEYFRRYNSKN